MRKMGCWTFFLLIILALFAYNQYQIISLRKQVLEMSSMIHGDTSTNAKTTSDKDDPPDLMTSLAEAEKYTKKAREYINAKNVEKAQQELDKALKSLKSANDVSSDVVGKAAEVLGKAKDNAVRVFQKAYSDISEEAKPVEEKS